MPCSIASISKKPHSMLQSKRFLGCLCEFDLGLVKIQIRTFDEDELACGACGTDGIDSSLVLYQNLSMRVGLRARGHTRANASVAGIP